jgi:demethyllactenocin mycarosyltransferase
VLTGLGRLLIRAGTGLTVDAFLTDDDRAPALVHCPRSFQYAGDRAGAGLHFVGPCRNPSPIYPRWERPPGGRPIALVSLGTIHNQGHHLFQRCVAALTELGWHTVVTAGSDPLPEPLRRLPATAEAHPFLAQRDVLDHAGVVINHGGMGTLMDSLAAGVPVIAVPQMAEHRANADRIVELGLGRLLSPADATHDAVAHAVRAVTTDSAVAARLDAMRRDITAAGGADAAATVIEHHLAQSATLTPVSR